MILMVVALFSMTMTTYADNDNANAMLNVEAYDMNVNMRKLAVALDMTVDQMEAVQDIHHTFCVEMMMAAHANKDEREKLVVIFSTRSSTTSTFCCSTPLCATVA